jgi:alkylation response protein AidB-like acyl-CoA dehydrogenase
VLYPGPYLAHVGGQKQAMGLSFDDGGDIPSVDPMRPLRGTEGGWTSHETPRFRAACAAEALGVAQRALDLGVEHAKTREQFGKPIGTYQAVSHPLAQTYTDVELARSLVYWAAWCVAEKDERAEVAAAAAKAFATEAAVAACERSIQVHGGIGFTWEHPLHRFYKRALWLEGFGVRPAELRLEVANLLLA